MFNSHAKRYAQVSTTFHTKQISAQALCRSASCTRTNVLMQYFLGYLSTFILAYAAALSLNVNRTGLWSLVANPVSILCACASTLFETINPSTVVVYVTPFS